MSSGVSAISYPAKNMNRNGMTASPVPALCDSANEPESPVTMMYEINMVDALARNSRRRPRRSTSTAARTAQMRFHACRQPEMSVWSRTEVTLIEVRIIGK